MTRPAALEVSLETAAKATESVRTRFADYRELGKPGIAIMVAVTAAVGALAAGGGATPFWKVVTVSLATVILSAGAGALNHWMEREVDKRMKRTARRPLPSGRLSASEALFAGIALCVAGATFLFLVGGTVAGIIGVLSAILYVAVYTPMKLVSEWNTFVGAFPGALPVLIGWTSVDTTVGPAAWLIFALLFVWQFPHFFAIAWIYREDYAAAGMRMFPSTPLGERYTGVQTTALCAILLAISLAPPLVDLGGPVYLIGAFACGLYFLTYAVAFQRNPTNRRAKLLMASSLIYLASMMGLLLVTMAVRA
jgi:protoheme IX farnesyltransferase